MIKLLFFTAFLALAAQCYSQEIQKIPQGLQQSATNINQDDWNLVDYQFKVEEIQTKIDYTKSNPKSHAKAESLNWYEGANKTLAAAKHERDTHIEKYLYKKIVGFPIKLNTGNPENDNVLYEKQLSEWVQQNPHTTKDHK